MQWADGTFLLWYQDRVLWSPLKIKKLFRLETISGNHTVEPSNVFSFAVEDQAEILIYNPLIQGRLVSHN
jgi:hypothetical protein